MTKAETIHNICVFPRTKHDKNTIPIIKLYAAIGYEENYKLITQEDILEYLGKHSDLILDWENYSDMNRSAPSWFFYQKKGGFYTVGYLDIAKTTYELFFSKALDACTLYIKMEFEAFRRLYKDYKLENSQPFPNS